MPRGSARGSARYSAAADIVGRCSLPFLATGSALPVDVVGNEILAVANGNAVSVLQVRPCLCYILRNDAEGCGHRITCCVASLNKSAQFCSWATQRAVLWPAGPQYDASLLQAIAASLFAVAASASYLGTPAEHTLDAAIFDNIIEYTQSASEPAA